MRAGGGTGRGLLGGRGGSSSRQKRISKTTLAATDFIIFSTKRGIVVAGFVGWETVMIWKNNTGRGEEVWSEF